MKVASRLRYATIGFIGIALLIGGANLVWGTPGNEPATTTALLGGGVMIVGGVSFLLSVGLLRTFLFDPTPPPTGLADDLVRITRCSAATAVVGGGAQLLGVSYPTSLYIYLGTAGLLIIAEIMYLLHKS